MQEYRNNQGHTHGQESDKIFLIEPLLPVGKENRISSSELVRLAGCGSVRELQKRMDLKIYLSIPAKQTEAFLCFGVALSG